jgi:hypothetical protein
MQGLVVFVLIAIGQHHFTLSPTFGAPRGSVVATRRDDRWHPSWAPSMGQDIPESEGFGYRALSRYALIE